MTRAVSASHCVKRRGSVVTILEDFASDSLDSTQLKKHQFGIVKDVDEEGDILVEFGGGDPQWIFSDNFSKLQVALEPGAGKEGAAANAKRDQTKEAPLREVEVGSTVIARRDFKSDSAEREALSTGQTGLVKRLDGDGDALIEFRGLQKPQWVFKAAFDNLCVLQAKSDGDAKSDSDSDSNSEEGEEEPEALKASIQEPAHRLPRPDAPLASPPSSSTDPPPLLAARGAKALHIGARVSVTQDFLSDSEQPVRLKQGQCGVVKDVDNEGDALVDFEALPSHQWIFKPNLEKLIVLKDTTPE